MAPIGTGLMTLHQWLLYLAVILLSTWTPGPAVLLSVSNALAQGLRASLLSSLGNVSGLFCLSAATFVGIGTVLRGSPNAFAVLKFAGATYLVYLGVQRWRSAGAQAARPQTAPRPARAAHSLFGQGALVALTNPKGLLFFGALFPQFIDAQRPLLAQFFALTLTLMLFSLLALMGYASLAHASRNWLANGTRGRWMGRLSGLAFVGLGLALLRIEGIAR